MLNTTRAAGSTAALAAAAAATAAGATDAAAQGRLPQASTWGGFFIGGSIGGSWLNSSGKGSTAQQVLQGYTASLTTGGVESVGNSDAFNAIGGLQGGFNWQNGRTVYGFEADFSWLGKKNATSSGTLQLTYGNIGYNGTSSRQSRVEAVATFRGRFGYDFNGTMPYLTAGLALGQIKSTWSFSGVNSLYGITTVAATSKTSWEPGFVVGGGVEQKLAGNWSIRADVQWMKFAEQKLNNPVANTTIAAITGNGGTINFQNSLAIAKFGLNYRF